jgi:light-regulated signal transduction histidine kinase (bacteriophytochrome)
MEHALDRCICIQKSENRWIKVKLKTKPPYIYLSVKNARHGKINKNGSTYISTKNDAIQHGHGIKVVREIAKKHDGFASFEHTQDSFSAEIALRINKDF